MKLGTIKKIDLRDIWSSESADFTPWLAKEDNIAHLGSAIGMDLEVESLEKNVGPFRADILARDIAKKIEDELDYPGQIKVTVVREFRTTEIAK